MTPPLPSRRHVSPLMRALSGLLVLAFLVAAWRAFSEDLVPSEAVFQLVLVFGGLFWFSLFGTAALFGRAPRWFEWLLTRGRVTPDPPDHV
jgi:hypothetical protein